MMFTRRQYLYTSVLYLIVIETTNGLQLPDIYWHPHEPMFNRTICSHTSTDIYVREYDSLNVICCNRDLNNAVIGTTSGAKTSDMHNYNIIVTDSKQLFEQRKTVTSDSSNAQASIVYNCKQQLASNKFSGLFRAAVDKYHVQFSPFGTAAGRTFEAGKTYYFYTTSDGSEQSLKNTQAPKKVQHMAFRVHVCRNHENCGERSRISRCVQQDAITKRRSYPYNNDDGSDNDSQKTQWSHPNLIITVVIALVGGLILGCILDRLYILYKKPKKFSGEQQTSLGKAEEGGSSCYSSTSTAHEDVNLMPRKVDL